VAGRPDVEMVEAFSGLERHLEAALAAARAPAAPPEARPSASGNGPAGSGARSARCLRGGLPCRGRLAQARREKDREPW